MTGFLEHYLMRLGDPLRDPRTIELAINGDASIWVEKVGDTYMSRLPDLEISPKQVTDLAKQVAKKAGLPLTADVPLVATTVPFQGATLRAQAIISPATATGSVLSFRLFRQRLAEEEPKKFTFLRSQEISLQEERIKRIHAIRDVAQGAGSGTDIDTVLQSCVRQKLNVVISGGTSTGKTELLRRMVWMIPDEERLVLIEDSAELLPHHANQVSLISARSENSERSADRLLQASLRLRPDRIFMGEVRDTAAYTFLEAINTGHSGSGTSIHAETPRKAMDRLALLVMNTGTQLNYSEILRYLKGSIDVVIQTGRTADRRGVMETYFPTLDDRLV